MSVPVNLSDMECELCEVEVDPEENCGEITIEETVYLYPCRCGDCFEILESDLQQNQNAVDFSNNNRMNVFECQSCSLSISILDDVH